MKQYSGSQRSRVGFKELEAALNSKLSYNLFAFKYQTTFMKVTDATVMTSIGFQVQNKDLTFQKQDGRTMVATVNIFGRITDSRGFVWEEFEAQMKPEAPNSFFKKMNFLLPKDGTSKGGPLQAGTGGEGCL